MGIIQQGILNFLHLLKAHYFIIDICGIFIYFLRRGGVAYNVENVQQERICCTGGFLKEKIE